MNIISRVFDVSFMSGETIMMLYVFMRCHSMCHGNHFTSPFIVRSPAFICIIFFNGSYLEELQTVHSRLCDSANVASVSPLLSTSIFRRFKIERITRSVSKRIRL